MISYGTDIKVLSGELQIAANGEALLVYEVDTVFQDILDRLSTYYGTLFYDPYYGSYVMDFVKDESTDENRFALCEEIVRRVEADPRVKEATPQARILTWDVNSVTVALSLELTGIDSVFNKVLSVDKSTREMVLYEAA